MLAAGWRESGTLTGRHSQQAISWGAWPLYTRDCKAGESFVLRNHKYQAPIVFSEKTYFKGGPVDGAPPALGELERRQAEERLALLAEQFNSMFMQKRFAEAFGIARQTKREFPSSPVADLMLGRSQEVMKAAGQDAAALTTDSVDPMGSVPGSAANAVRPDAIRLDASRLRTQLANEVGEPAVFGTHGAGVENVNLPELFLSRQAGPPIDGWIARDGYGLLLGQIPVMAHPDDRFELERFERTGNQVRVVFRQYSTNSEFSAVINRGGVFPDAAAEEFLTAAIRSCDEIIHSHRAAGRAGLVQRAAQSHGKNRGRRQRARAGGRASRR